MAPLQWQTIDFKFDRGLDQKTSPEHTPIGRLPMLQNGEFSKLGTLSKRAGSTVFGNTPELATTSYKKGVSLFCRNNEELLRVMQRQQSSTLARDAQRDWTLESYSTALAKWRDVGKLTPLEISVVRAKEAAPIARPDMAIIGNYACVAWIGHYATPFSNPGIWYRIIDITTGAVIGEAYIAGTFHAVSVLPIGTSFWIWTINNATHAPQGLRINTANLPTLPTSWTTVLTAGSASEYWDVCKYSSDGTDKTFLAYDLGTANIGLSSINEAGTVSTWSPFATSPQQVFGVECLVDYNTVNTRLAVFYSKAESSIAYLRTFSTAGVAVLGETAMHDGGGSAPVRITLASEPSVSSASLRFFIEYYDASASGSGNLIYSDTMTFAGVVSGANYWTLYNTNLASRAFSPDPTYGLAHVLVEKSSETQPTFFLVKTWSNGTNRHVACVARLFAGRASTHYYTALTDSEFILPHVLVGTNTAFHLALSFKESAIYGASNYVTFESIAWVTLQWPKLPSVVEGHYGIGCLDRANTDRGGLAIATGGLLGEYDKTLFREIGFHLGPDAADITLTASVTGGLLSNGTHYYAVLYEWTDNLGHKQYSTPAYVSKLITGGGAVQSIAIVVGTLGLGEYNKLVNTRVLIYRKMSDGLYHQINVLSGEWTINSLAAATVTYTDDQSADYLIGPTMPFDAGVIEPVSPPACSIMCLAMGRLWAVPSDDPMTLWFSKQKADGVGYQFSDSLVIRLPDGGPITALAPLEDKLIVFKASSIYVIGGNGPNDLGTGSWWSEPRLVSSNVGSPYRGSVAPCPQGIAFKAVTGYYMLTQSLGLQDIGVVIDDDRNLVVQKTIIVPNKTQIRFQIAYTGGTGKMLVYDWVAGQWSEWTGMRLFDAVIFGNNVYSCAREDGSIVYENPYSYIDTWAGVKYGITMLIETGPLRIAGHGGIQRVKWIEILGSYHDKHLLQIYYYIDDEDDQREMPMFYVNDDIGDQPYRIRFKPRMQKNTAVRLRIREWIYDDSQSATCTAGFSLTGIRMIAAAKTPSPKIGASRTI